MAGVASSRVGSSSDLFPVYGVDEPAARVGAGAYDARLVGRWRISRRGVVVSGIVGALAVYVAVVVGLEATAQRGHSGLGSTTPDWVTDLAGRVLTANSDGSMVLTEPDGLNGVVARGLDFSPGTIPAAAPDGRLVVDQDGNVRRVVGGQLLTAPRPIGLTDQMSIAVPDPFADHDRALVVLSAGDVFVLSLVGHGSVALGSADYAAADPQGVGAFVSVLVSKQPNTAVNPNAGLADSELESRAAGHSPVVLALAADLNRQVEQDPSTPVHLAAYPDPSADKVAVVVTSLTSLATNAPMVIVDRHGRSLAAVSAEVGPTDNTVPAWSPDGRSLAWTTFGPQGTQLATWSVHEPIRARLAPDPASVSSGCVWSPTGSAVICAMVPTGVGDIPGWLLGRGGGGSLYFVGHAPGTPVAWIPATAH